MTPPATSDWRAQAGTWFAVVLLAWPGGLKGSGSGQVADTKFSVTRGFFTAPFQVAITTSTNDATIRYTVDGSPPTETTGVIYAGPLTIDHTTVLRVAAFKADLAPTNVDTQTYIFPDDVIIQSPTGDPPPGWPPRGISVNGQYFDYGMDPLIVNNANPALGGPAAVKNALMALPTVSLAIAQDALNGPNGIYTNASQHGASWERPASIELMNDPNGPGFHANCGLRIRGNFSRDDGNPKHAFRVLFSSDYGDPKLHYAIYGADGTDEFDAFDIQTSQDFSWAYEGSDMNNFLREIWSRDTQGDMGHPHTRGRFVQLYLNGQYWGQYQIEERPEASFGATYLGGVKEDYDVIKSTGQSGNYQIEATDGFLTGPAPGQAAWESLWNQSRSHYAAPDEAKFFKLIGLAADGVTPSGDPPLLDLDNFIDYMLVIFFSGNTDSPSSIYVNQQPNNFYAMRRRGGNRGFVFFTHDAEVSLDADGRDVDRVGPFRPAISSQFRYGNPQFTHEDLLPSAEYRVRFGDRAHRHLYNNGALTLARCQARLNARAAQIETSVIAESARWGNSKTAPALTKANWIAARDASLSWLVGRRELFLGQLRGVGLYPEIEAPVFNQWGGILTAASPLRMSGPATIFYTVDGRDPRMAGGGIGDSVLSVSGGPPSGTIVLVPQGAVWKYNNLNQNLGTAWRAAAYDDAAWSSGPAELGNGDAADGRPEATMIDIGPASDRYPTVYFRRKFTLASLVGIDGLTLELRRDDGAAVYLNGVEVVRDNLPSGSILFSTLSQYSVVGDGEHALYQFPLSPTKLVAGENTLAVEVHQSSATSPDLSFDMRLTAHAPPVFGNPIIDLAGPARVTVKARSRDASGAWSALATSDYLVDAEPADAANLTVSELMYHPANDDEEFLELINVGPRAIDLTGVHFTTGIVFTFPNGTPLLPVGTRILLVKNRAAFEARYGATLPVAGEYSGGLSNSTDHLTLVAASGATIRDFTYGSSEPWPPEADGGDRSLVLIHPSAATDPNLPENWRLSAIPDGSPGASDALGYPLWKILNNITSDSDDPDGDGLSNLCEYALGARPDEPSIDALPVGAVQPFMVGGTLGDYPSLIVRQPLGVDDVALRVEASSDLVTWSANDVVLARQILNADGTMTRVYRTANPLSAADRIFLRAHAVIR